jgi:hypothetical protein
MGKTAKGWRDRLGILQSGWPELSDCRGTVAVGARHRQKRLGSEEIAAEVVVEIGKYPVVLDERHWRVRQQIEVARVEGREAAPEHVAVRPGISKPVSRGDGRRIRHRERREERMAVFEMDALGPNRPERGRVLLGNRSVAHPVGHEDQDVPAGRRRALPQGRQQSSRAQRRGTYQSLNRSVHVAASYRMPSRPHACDV